MTNAHSNGIISKLCQVMREVKAIEKAHVFSGGNRTYTYRSIEDVMAAYHAAFEKNGILVVVGQPTITVRGTIQRTYKDGHVTVPVIDATFPITFTAEEGSLTTVAFGSAIADDDKYAGKIMSYGLKYALTMLTLCPYEDMPDTDKPDAAPQESSQAAKPAAKPRSSKAANPPATQTAADDTRKLSDQEIEQILETMDAVGVSRDDLISVYGPTEEWTNSIRAQLRDMYRRKKNEK